MGSHPYFKIEQIETILEKITFSQPEITIEFEYHLLTGYVPINWSKNTFSFIQRYFEQNLYTRWKYKSAPPSREWFDDQIKLIEKLLSGLKNEVFKIPSTSPSDEYSPSLFTFKLPKGKTDWVIFFRGKRVNMNDKKRRDVGFEAIRLLLNEPNNRYNALIFYDMNEFTKGQKQLTSENIDKANRDELEDRLRENKKYIDQAKDKKDAYTLSFLWEDRRQLLSILIAYSPENKRYRGLYTEALNNSQKYDPNFSAKKENKYGDLRPGGNYHNTATTLQKGIKAAIALMDDADFRAYLQLTIITSKKGKHEPFSYIPELSDIAIDYWDTE